MCVRVRRLVVICAPSLGIDSGMVECIDDLTYLGSCVSLNGLIADEMSSGLVPG